MTKPIIAKPILQFSIANEATETVRRNIKLHSAETSKETNKSVDTLARDLVRNLSRIDVEKADADTAARALNWGSRIARPYETGWKYGSHVGNGVDYLLSWLVGRGVKEDSHETLADLRKIDRTAFRQEGVLGLLTRGTAIALGCAVGACCLKYRPSVKQGFENVGVGFNAAARVMALTLPSLLCITTGILVGAGVSALTALVAVPLLWRTDKAGAGDDDKSVHGDEAPTAEKTKKDVGTDEAPPEDNANGSGSPRADKTSSKYPKLEREKKRVFDALNALQDTPAAVRYKAVAASWDKAMKSRDPQKIGKVRAELSKARSALQEEKDAIGKRAVLQEKRDAAWKEFDAWSASPDSAKGDEVSAALAKADTEFQEHVAAQGKLSQQAKKLPRKVEGLVKSYQENILKSAEEDARKGLLNGEMPQNFRADYKELEERWANLSRTGAIEAKELPLNKQIRDDLAEATKSVEADLANLKNYLRKLKSTPQDRESEIAKLEADLKAQKTAFAKLINDEKHDGTSGADNDILNKIQDLAKTIDARKRESVEADPNDVKIAHLTHMMMREYLVRILSRAHILGEQKEAINQFLAEYKAAKQALEQHPNVETST